MNVVHVFKPESNDYEAVLIWEYEAIDSNIAFQATSMAGIQPRRSPREDVLVIAENWANGVKMVERRDGNGWAYNSVEPLENMQVVAQKRKFDLKDIHTVDVQLVSDGYWGEGRLNYRIPFGPHRNEFHNSNHDLLNIMRDSRNSGYPFAVKMRYWR